MDGVRGQKAWCALALAMLTGTLLPADVRAAEVAAQMPEIQEAVAVSSDGDTAPATPAAHNVRPDVSGGPAATWIWPKGNPDRCFLKTAFDGAGLKSAALIASCDNLMTVSLNGKRVASSDTWQEPVVVDVTRQLAAGENVLSVDAGNQGGVAGLALKLVLVQNDGTRRYVVTDETWTGSLKADFAESVALAAGGKMGVGPWGDVFSSPGGSGGGLPKGRVPPGVFQVPAGFQVELLYTVPKDEQGSWVCLGLDHKGRLIASDQGDKGLYRITPAPIGSGEPTRVEKLDVAMTSAQGILSAFGSLYVCANGGPGSGLYRLRDTDGNDQYDNVEKLKAIQGGGEHGPHALRLSPDGKSIYLIAGNHTHPPENFESSRIPSNWGEDLLLPRQWDARGHARGILAPGGWIAKTDPEGKSWEMISVGYRNPYDFDFSPEGELFAYDADMEWDMGMPWYRPTRVVHATSGSEFGWRSGTGKWPTYYTDSLPQVVDIGPGSPVGVTFGTGAKFPQKYQRALFCCDWTFGTMYAVHLTEDGSSYTGTKEEFVSRTPLPLTDVVIGPDGAMYFTVGGRGTQSALYRVTWPGEVPADGTAAANPELAKLRDLRTKIELFHTGQAASTDDKALLISCLDHPDRHIRYAARIAVERTFTSEELKGLASGGHTADGQIQSAITWARQGSDEDNVQRLVLKRLATLNVQVLNERQQLDLLRAYGLIFTRKGLPDTESAAAVLMQIDALFPSSSDALNAELVQVLVSLNSPTVVTKALPLLADAPESAARDGETAIPDFLTRNSGYGGTVASVLRNQVNLPQARLVFALRNVKYGWTLEQRRQYLHWFTDASKKSGGASYQGFLDNIRKDFLDNATETERKALAGEIAATVLKEEDLPKPEGPGKAWTLDELAALTKNGLTGRSFEKGRRAYAASRCVQCHRFSGEGGATGPDLTSVAGRFSYRDLLESIIEPSRVVSDQYRASIITTNQGKVHNGRILSDFDGTVTVLVDPVDASRIVELRKSDIDEMVPSPVSLMPQKLVDPLNKDEILDLLAYLMSRGNPDDAVFGKP